MSISGRSRKKGVVPRFLERAGDVFATAAEKRGSERPSLKDLQTKIGQLAMENDFLAGALGRIDDASAKR
jgi:hypothetical protein